MTDDEALERAQEVQTELWQLYWVNDLGKDSVTLPGGGDWLKVVAHQIKRAYDEGREES